MELWINILKDYMVIVIVQLATFDLYMVKLMAKLCRYQQWCIITPGGQPYLNVYLLITSNIDLRTLGTGA